MEELKMEEEIMNINKLAGGAIQESIHYGLVREISKHL